MKSVMTQKEFLKKYTHLKIAMQHLEIHGGGYQIEVYNTTWNSIEPVFKYFISDMEIDKLKVNYETAIMVPIINWYEDGEIRNE